MQIRKPTKQAIAYRFFQHRKRNYISLCSLFMFPFDRPRDIETEQEMWPYAAGKLADLPLEEAFPKGAAELLVVGDCHAPAGRPVREAMVAVRLGGIGKRLRVTGPRRWKLRWDNLYQAGAPEPFTAVPIAWKTAYGGPDFDTNPLGLGHVAEELSAEHVPLPLVEYPDDLARDPDTRPRPASLRPIPLDWPQRAKRQGDYGKAYLQGGQFPGLAADTDFKAFNRAPADQWQKDWFAGDERFEVENMHPTRPQLRGRLPEIRARCFLRCGEEGEGLTFREVPQQLDTVWLFPGDLRGIVAYRGTAELATPFGDEIRHMLFAYERLGTPPRSLDHYQAELDLRIDPEKSAALLSYDRGLKPDDEGEPPPDPRLVVRFSAFRKDPLPAIAALAAGQEAALGQAVPALAGQLAAAREAAAKLVTPPEVAALDDLVLDFNRPELIDGEAIRAKVDAAGAALRAQAETEIATQRALRDELEAELRQRAAANGIDYDAFAQEMGAKANRPLSEIWAEGKEKYFEANKPFDAYGEEYRKLFADLKEEADKVDPQVAELDSLRREGERVMGHVLPLPALPSPQQAGLARAALEEAMAGGGSLKEQSLVGLDLSGMNFAGRDLEAADFRGAILRNADFSGARLVRASFAQADISGATFAGADLTEANLAKTAAAGTLFPKAKLVSANCAEMTGPKAVFAGADLSRAGLSKAALREADFSGATLADVVAMEGDLTAARFVEANLKQATFIGTPLAGADFSKAKLDTVLVQRGSLEGAVFEDAQIKRFGVQGEGATLKGARLARAAIDTCSVRELDLTGADFSGVLADRVDFSETRMHGTRFDGAVARSAAFTKARIDRCSFAGGNFAEAVWLEARVQRSDFTGAVLYGCNFLHAVLAENRFDKANIARSTLAGTSTP